MRPENIVVVGLGEVGKPLLMQVSRYYRTVGVDIAPPLEAVGDVEVMHICFPFQIRDFIGETLRYMEIYQPQLTVINSTVAVGTTRIIAERSGAPVVNSPVRGKHARMSEDMARYAKFVGAIDPADGHRAAAHFQSVGLTARILSSPEATELAKLSETTYFGLLIAWAQELERYCDQTGASYEEIITFYDEIRFLPQVRYFPGLIGGHCVMPNIEILRKMTSSALLDAICESNCLKAGREMRQSAGAEPELVALGATGNLT
jgi:UDP-N-acetyl-D-mannosaminuronate dehydrogenase